jgi:hypothetical protein
MLITAARIDFIRALASYGSVDKPMMDQPPFHIGNITHIIKNPYSSIHQHSNL